MCINTPKPPKIPKPPKPPKPAKEATAVMADTRTAQEDRAKKRTGVAGSIMTGGLGAKSDARTKIKKLLGV